MGVGNEFYIKFVFKCEFIVKKQFRQRSSSVSSGQGTFGLTRIRSTNFLSRLKGPLNCAIIASHRWFGHKCVLLFASFCESEFFLWNRWNLFPTWKKNIRPLSLSATLGFGNAFDNFKTSSIGKWHTQHEFVHGVCVCVCMCSHLFAKRFD